MLKGKIEIHNRVSVDSLSKDKNDTLELIYTPGVAYVAKEISKNKELTYDYTSKWNTVAIVCDGTRVLGLGNIGPEGAIPVMEGKSVLFKVLGGINAFPLCIDMKDKEEIIRFVKAIQPVFGAINIEDIESPKVLEIVERLTKSSNTSLPRRSAWYGCNHSRSSDNRSQVATQGNEYNKSSNSWCRFSWIWYI